MSRLTNYLRDALRNPREKLSRGQHFVRHSWELTAHCWRQLQRQRAEGMAAELTYRTIFSLVPIVVLGLVTFRIVGGLDEVKNTVENQLYSFFGLPTAIPSAYLESASPPTPEPASPPTPGEDRAADDLVGQPSEDSSSDFVAAGSAATARAPDDPSEAVNGESVDLAAAIAVSESNEQAAVDRARREALSDIHQRLHEVTSQVANIDFRSIGALGLLLFIYAAIALADSVEHLFNRIYDAPEQRPVHIRLAIHWSIITLGSGLLAMSLYLSGEVVEWFGTRGAGAGFRLVLSHALSIAASWVLLFLLYALMPNTTVSVRAAAIGSLVGALLWEGAKFGFQVYVVKAVPYSKIYGSIGLIPLFLFWIYVTWLIVLFGLILTYTLQTLGGRSLRRDQWQDEPLPTGDPDWMLPIMCEVGNAFEVGESIDNQALAGRIGLPGRIVSELTGKLVEAAMLRKVTSGAGEEHALTLARPSEKIPIDEILALAHRSRPTSDHPAWRTLAGLKLAERQAAEGKTLAEVIAH